MLQRSAVCSSFAVLTALILAAPSIGRAQEAVTMRGEIVDLACYMAKGSRGLGHKPCAVLCAKKGLPIGLLTDKGELFLLLGDDQNLDGYEAAKQLAGDQVELHGKKLNKEGMSALAVGSVKLAAGSASERVAAAARARQLR
jgi:hypothetical protein